VIFVYGTTGELIKIAPVVRRLRESGVEPVMVCTGQQFQQIPGMSDDLGVPQPHLWLGRGRGGHDLERSADIPIWGSRLAVQILRQRAVLKGAAATGPGVPTVVVHGDTFTTVIGTLIGKLIGVRVAHIEAGLRSGSWQSPFPEELNRRLVSKLARLHLCPGAEAVENLQREGTAGEIVDTLRNTVYDNLFDPPVPVGFDVPERFGLVSIHRFELLRKVDDTREVLEVLRETADRDTLLFVDHPTTMAAITGHGLDALLDHPNIRRIPRVPYQRFISLLRKSEYLVTDSGGSQEECGYLGHPCVVHRDRSERSVGFDGSVLLTGADIAELRRFLVDPTSWRTEPQGQRESPSALCVDQLVAP
jgi:UDP-N-acetylglucosamine 2-epimerase (non-hydrolysing)